MSGWLHAGAALALALGLHLGAFALPNGAGGVQSSGQAGTALVSLQAADATVAELVAQWDAPAPVVAEGPAGLAVPTPPDALPPPPRMASPMPDAPAAQSMAFAPPVDLPPLAHPGPPPPPPAVTPPPPPPPAVEPPPQAVAAPVVAPIAATIRPMPRPKAKAATPKAVARAPAKPEAPQTAAPQKKPPTAAVAAQKAAGSGGGTKAGQAGTAKVATLSAAKVRSLKSEWGASIRARIERRKTYPAAARGAAGKVSVRLSVSRSGQLLAASVSASSGNAALDQAALRAVKSAGKFPVAPKALTEASFSFTLPMTFSR